MSKRKKVGRLSDGRMPWEPKAATLERRNQCRELDPLIRETQRRSPGLRPDLGTELLLRGVDHPFTLALYGGYTLGYDRVLGWMYSGVCNLYMAKDCPPFISDCSEISRAMASIAFGKISKHEAERLTDDLRGSGLTVQASRSDGYRTSSGSEYVVPLKVVR